MKLVINKEYGGFSLPKKFCTQYNIDEYEDIDRTDDRLINFIENHSGHVKISYGDLVIVEIPNESTDYYIDEYDGLETVIYVLDGKIHFA